MPKKTEDPLNIAHRIFEKGCRKKGRAALTPEQLDIFHLYRFATENEMGGLTSFLYNIAADPAEVAALAGALRRHGRKKLASHLDTVHGIVSAIPADHDGDWSECLEAADPKGRLDKLEDSLAGCYDDLMEEVEKLAAQHPLK